MDIKCSECGYRMRETSGWGGNPTGLVACTNSDCDQYEPYLKAH